MIRASTATALASTLLIVAGWWASRHLADRFSADGASYIAGVGFLLIPMWVLLDRRERRRIGGRQDARHVPPHSDA